MRSAILSMLFTAALGCASARPIDPFTAGIAHMTREEGVAYLAGLAAIDAGERLLVYVPSHGTWHDISVRRTPDERDAVVVREPILVHLCHEYDAVEIYHQHRFRDGAFQHEGGVRYGIWDREEARELDWAIHGYPSSDADLVTSVLQGYTFCSGTRVSFGVVSLERPTARAESGPGFRVIRWAPDRNPLRWPMDEDGVTTEVFDGLRRRAQEDAAVAEAIITQGVLARRELDAILQDLSARTPLTFWKEP